MRAVRACEHGMVAGSVGGGYAQSRLWFPVATPTPFLLVFGCEASKHRRDRLRVYDTCTCMWLCSIGPLLGLVACRGVAATLNLCTSS